MFVILLSNRASEHSKFCKLVAAREILSGFFCSLGGSIPPEVATWISVLSNKQSPQLFINPFYGPQKNSKYLTKKPPTKMSVFFLLSSCTQNLFLKTITKLCRNN